ncbi:WGR domain-containing protein [Emticicia sp. C21]|uniref:WGR domain-containing protein n=1 Tax=Emticicia sp. C21 TaxID=2302915 RepID=UPI000E34A8A5|nr:WGR domain-containing protein [Emticicia sp. C21]RFS13770.1 WGR domain-containing protein [Emticicia sp. C21]
MTKTYLELSEEQGSAHKFYEVTVDDTNVSIRFGRIGDNGQGQNSSFATVDEAQVFAEKKIKEKQKKGYVMAIQGQRQKRSVTRRAVESRPAQIKYSLPIVWRFKTESSAFGVYVDERSCWVGNEKGDVFRLNHSGEVDLHHRLPDGVKCIVADNDWIYIGCDDGNVYDLTGKRPRLSYEIQEKIEIYWLDINDGLLGVSSANGSATIINYEDEEQWSKKQDGTGAWMMRCDDRGKIFCGDSVGIVSYNGPDGKFEWKTQTEGSVLFGWMTEDKVYAATGRNSVQAFSKDGVHLKNYRTDAIVYSCATSPDGAFIFAGDNYSSIYCFDEAGNRLWKLATGCGSALSMQYFNEHLYIVTTDGSMACIDAKQESINQAQEGVLPTVKDVKIAATQLSQAIEIRDTAIIETAASNATGILVKCVKEGSSLRVKPLSDGFHKDWYVQFPKNLREENTIYIVDELREATQGGFYRVFGNILKYNQN